MPNYEVIGADRRFRNLVHNLCHQQEKAKSSLKALLRETYPGRSEEWYFDKTSEVIEKFAELYT
jgi:hypothetical protein